MRYDSVMSDVVLREEEVGVLRQLSGWPGSFESAAGAAMRRMGFAGVGEFGRAQVGEAGAAFRVAPERVWIRTRDAEGLGEGARGGFDAGADVGFDGVASGFCGFGGGGKG